MNISRISTSAILATLALTLPGCRLVEGIFKAGVWVGVIVVVALVIVGVGIASLVRR